ncbi:MAG TPA: FAD-dependent oxidoreductase [Candidatus Limnocylindria bacterium]|nr:FAD-dependent oxidoreductase [Candidatus Limnocylindria bacterium]
MSRTINRVTIIGGSLAGASAAFALREAGFDGSVTLVGEERHLPYERPPLSKAYLRGEEPADRAAVRPEADYAAHGVELISGHRAVTIDRDARIVELDDDRRLRYDALILATGASPRRLSVTRGYLAGVHYLRTRDQADGLRAAAATASSIVVVGGGWIGTEAAASLRQMGAEVTLVTNLDYPLERVLGPEVGAIYGDLHRAQGVRIVPGHVTGLVGDDRVCGVRLADGQVLPADVVVAGVGAVPRVGLALRAGLATSEGGVAADAHLRTSDPAIFVAGDVAAAFHPRYGKRIRVEHWDNAREQGATAARNVLGAGEIYDRVPYFYSDQFDLGMEVRGRTLGSDRAVIRGDVARREFLAFWLSEGRVVAAMNANIWDVGDDLAAMVATGARIEPERLADDGVPLGAMAA